MSDDREMAWLFPQPSKLIVSAFAELQNARIEEAASKGTQLPDAGMARPWDPASCPPTLQMEVWVWLEAVVLWINRSYTWQADQAIPSCWPRHPHIVHEVAVLASLRLAAGHALTADPLEEWHRYALPGFFDRMRARAGSAACQPGTHKPWPGLGRLTEYQKPVEQQRRAEAFAGGVPRNRNTPPPAPNRPGRAPRLLTAVAPDTSAGGTS